MYEFITIHNDIEKTLPVIKIVTLCSLVYICIHVALGGRKESRIQHVHCDRKENISYILN